MNIECGGFTFSSNFDSGNIDRVEFVPQSENDESEETKNISLYEFNIWTRPDCDGTEFANNNKSWFYFGVTGGAPCSDVKLNVMNLNKQGKLFNQGMAPVYRTVPGPNDWERVQYRLSFDLKQNLLSFGYRTLDNLYSTTYFAFTYPYSFVDLQNFFKLHDGELKKLNVSSKSLDAQPDDIYYYRESLIYSLEGRPVELITITSHHGITTVYEPRLKGLFPDVNAPRPHQFKGKKVIFLSARVHPGETPSSFVINGVLNLLLTKNDPTAVLLRKMFVFKLIPMLNPDGVSNGYYRTDTRGVNLNRFYLNPSRGFHPPIFAARALILYYHFGYEIGEKELEKLSGSDPSEPKSPNVTFPNLQNDDTVLGELVRESDEKDEDCNEIANDIISACSPVSIAESSSNDDCDLKIASDTENLNDKVSEITVAEKMSERQLGSLDDCNPDRALQEDKCFMCGSGAPSLPKNSPTTSNESNTRKKINKTRRVVKCKPDECKTSCDSGLFLYIDFHGHASKKGIFMFGNHFDNVKDKVECLLLPKLLSINNPHFHYNQCNFTRRNMYTKDRRDGMSKEGCGRVAVLKYTGLIKSYTLECNYNTGCVVNIIPPVQRPLGKTIVQPFHVVPTKYTPQIYEEVGRALCVSILDMTGCNPNSRLPLSPYKTVSGLRDFLRGEMLVARSIQSQHNLKIKQNIALLQRGSKTVSKNFATKRGQFLSLKRPPKTSLFSELPSQSTEKKEIMPPTGLSSKNIRSNSPASILHPLNKCNISSNTIGLLKKQGKTKLSLKKKNKLLLKKKMFKAYKLEKEILPNKGEFSEWNPTSKRKIEKKSSRSGNPSSNVRPPNKKRKKSKIL